MRDTAGHVIILGSQDLQATLLGNLIEEKTGIRSSSVRRLTDLFKLSSEAAPNLVLMDAQGASHAELTEQLDVIAQHARPFYVAFINAEKGGAVEDLVLREEVRGIFYLQSTPDQLIKGVRALMAGEFWFSRRLLTSHFNRVRRQTPCHALSPALLTEKEIQVLTWLTRGDSNTVIAQRLHVSMHTVKTHLYNLFRKINARNRVQAVLWAQQHLPTTTSKHE